MLLRRGIQISNCVTISTLLTNILADGSSIRFDLNPHQGPGEGIELFERPVFSFIGNRFNSLMRVESRARKFGVDG